MIANVFLKLLNSFWKLWVTQFFYDVLNSADYGVPQTRNRLFIL